MNNLGPLVFKDEAPVYVLERQPYPERSETRYVIWVKDNGIKITTGELSQLLADVLASQVKRTDMERNGSIDTTGTANPPQGAPHD